MTSERPFAPPCELLDIPLGEPHGFEFIDVADWCRAAADVPDFIAHPRTWLPLFGPDSVDGSRFRPPDGLSYGSGSMPQPLPKPTATASTMEVVQKNLRRFTKRRATLDDLLSKTSPNIGLSAQQILSGKVSASGSLVANLGPAVVIASSLIVLVRQNLALTEGFGDVKAMRHQRANWPKTHFHPASIVGLDRGRPYFTRTNAYTLDHATPMIVDEPCVYLSVRRDDRNPYHWIFETLPRLRCLQVIPELRDLPLLMRDPPTVFQRAFLDWMGVKNRILVSEGRNIRCGNLIFPSIPYPPPLHPQVIAWLKAEILSGQPLPLRSSRRRLLISRRDGGNGRRVANEDELARRLAAFGFERLTLSEIEPAEQIRAFREAEIVVLPHGAAGALLLFAPGDCRVIELQSPRQLNSLYFVLSRMMGQEYSVLLGKGARRTNDYSVDPGELTTLVSNIDAMHTEAVTATR